MHIAGFTGLSWPFNDKFNMSGGVRVEYNNQQLESRTYADKPVNIDNTVISILPSVNTSYNITQKSLVRFAYSRSVNRPEFRELAPFWYYDFTFNNLLTGNPALKTPEINNYDLRWELYPSAGEMLTVAGFYKEFTNPIEMFFIPGAGSGGTRNFTFDNAEKARSFGAEIELKKGFTTLYDSTNSRKNSFFKKLISRSGISFNAAWIDSKVILGDKAVGQSSDRPMMGQSPFIINAGLFYADTDHKLQVSALYNIIGKRIFAVGTYGTPDIYYMPRNSLDLTFTKGFGKYLEIKAGVQDLLSQDEVYSQDSDENGAINSRDEDVLIIDRGACYTLGVQFKF
jgi:TonB-dependent receptor